MKTQVALLRTTKVILFSLVALVLALTPLQYAGAEGLITATTPNRTIRFPAKALKFPQHLPRPSPKPPQDCAGNPSFESRLSDGR